MFIKKFKFVCLATLLVMIPLLSVADIEVRKITPPNLETTHLGRKILCHRPMRHIIAHNWTLGPGSAVYVNNLLLNSQTDLTQDEPITIVGAGALGLFTVYDLQQKGFRNITIIAENFEGLIP